MLKFSSGRLCLPHHQLIIDYFLDLKSYEKRSRRLQILSNLDP